MATSFFSKIVKRNAHVNVAELPRRQPVGRSPIAMPLLETARINLPRLARPSFATDNFSIAVPPGQQFSHALATTVMGSTAGSAARVTAQPNQGHTGSGTLAVMWFCPPGGSMRYRIRAYANPVPQPAVGNTPATEPEEILVLNNESYERLRALLDAGLPFRVVFEGIEALLLHNSGAFNQQAAAAPGVSFAISTPVWIIGIIAAAGVTALTILVIQNIVLAAIDLGYGVDVDFHAGGFDVTTGKFTLPRFEIELTTPIN